MSAKSKYYVEGGLGIDLLGAPELMKFFNKDLDLKQQRNVVISAYRKLARPIIQGARSTLSSHKKHGTLARSLRVHPFRRRVGVYVGAKKTGQLTRGTDRKTFKGHDGYYAHMVDQGTRGNSGVNFWEPAVEQNARQIGSRMQVESKKALERHIQRNLKRMNLN